MLLDRLGETRHDSDEKMGVSRTGHGMEKDFWTP